MIIFNDLFQPSWFRGLARNFLKGSIKFLKMLATIVGQRKTFLSFGKAKTIKLGILSMIQHAQILKPFFHPHNT